MFGVIFAVMGLTLNLIPGRLQIETLSIITRFRETIILIRETLPQETLKHIWIDTTISRVLILLGVIALLGEIILLKHGKYLSGTSLSVLD